MAAENGTDCADISVHGRTLMDYISYSVQTPGLTIHGEKRGGGGAGRGGGVGVKMGEESDDVLCTRCIPDTKRQLASRDNLPCFVMLLIAVHHDHHWRIPNISPPRTA